MLPRERLEPGLGGRASHHAAEIEQRELVDRRRARERDITRQLARSAIRRLAAERTGADAAERAGERAALALLEDRGLPHDAARSQVLETELARIGRFREVLEAAFPFPAQWATAITDDTTLCRCEEVRAGEVRRAIAGFGVHELNRLKAVSRIGMGRCQGRICGAAAAEILAHETGRELAAVGRLRSQAPVKPIPLTLALDAHREAAE